MKESKTARASAVKAPKAEKQQLTPAQQISELRKLREAHLFICNMEYVDALLSEYDQAQVAYARLACDLTAATTQVNNWKTIANERAGKIAADFETIARLEEELTDAQQDAVEATKLASELEKQLASKPRKRKEAHAAQSDAGQVAEQQS